MKTILLETLLLHARNLRSDGGENPEYDRALVELVADVMGEGKEAAQKALSPLITYSVEVPGTLRIAFRMTVEAGSAAEALDACRKRAALAAMLVDNALSFRESGWTIEDGTMALLFGEPEVLESTPVKSSQFPPGVCPVCGAQEQKGEAHDRVVHGVELAFDKPATTYAFVGYKFVFGSPFSTSRNGKTGTILRQYYIREEGISVPDLWEVKFDDGTIADAWGGELYDPVDQRLLERSHQLAKDGKSWSYLAIPRL